AGQAGGRHAGRDQHQDAGIGHRFKGLETGRFPRREMEWGWGESGAVYTGCQTPGKPISQFQTRGDKKERLILPRLVLAAVWGRRVILAVWGLAGNGLLRTQ
ncbi:hypothetical protein, partial [Bradyrhizobium neotropicale]|uniref:hypothetical protein n=1 Tax=Bradyrhizobium neotropicale TaxID=1497615 RepID=UPI001AECD16C